MSELGKPVSHIEPCLPVFYLENQVDSPTALLGDWRYSNSPGLTDGRISLGLF